MPDDVTFKPDLYRGIAGDYDRYRVPYSEAMVGDLLARTKPSGTGRLMDLACGTGQITFTVADHFAEAWAVDQEQDMIDVVRLKAAASTNTQVRTVLVRAEDLRAPDGSFELITIGNAFHRLRRDVVGSRALRWLEPGGHLALLWSSLPWSGDLEWQRAMCEVLDGWKARTGVADRLPAGWDTVREHRPDATVLKAAGFEPVGSFPHPTPHDWSFDALIGFVYSTSTLPRKVLGDRTAALESDLRRALGSYLGDGHVRGIVSFSFELARRPASPAVHGPESVDRLS